VTTFLERQAEIRRQQGKEPIDSMSIQGFAEGELGPPAEATRLVYEGAAGDGQPADGPEPSPLVRAAMPRNLEPEYRPKALEHKQAAEAEQAQQAAMAQVQSDLIIVGELASFRGRAVKLNEKAYNRICAFVLQAVAQDAQAELSALNPKTRKAKWPEPTPISSPSPKKRGRPRRSTAKGSTASAPSAPAES
jgi:hypothetical protein